MSFHQLQGISSSSLQRRFRPLHEAISEAQSRDEISVIIDPVSSQQLNYSIGRQQAQTGNALLDKRKQSYLSFNGVSSQSLSQQTTTGQQQIGILSSNAVAGCGLLSNNMQNSIELSQRTSQQSPQGPSIKQEVDEGFRQSKILVIQQMATFSNSYNCAPQKDEQNEEMNLQSSFSNASPNSNLKFQQDKGTLSQVSQLQCSNQFTFSPSSISMSEGEEIVTEGRGTKKKSTFARINAFPVIDYEDESKISNKDQELLICEFCKEKFNYTQLLATSKSNRCEKIVHRLFEVCYPCQCQKHFFCPHCDNKLTDNYQLQS